MDNRASWISPSGKVIEADINHISVVLQNPSLFGLNKTRLVSIYKNFKEPIGHEGKAREEIMYDLIKKGWIRCRYLTRQSEWHVQCWTLDKKTAENIWLWSTELKGSPYDIIKVMSLKDGDIIESSVEEMKHGKGLVENKKKRLSLLRAYKESL